MSREVCFFCLKVIDPTATPSSSSARSGDGDDDREKQSDDVVVEEVDEELVKVEPGYEVEVIVGGGDEICDKYYNSCSPSPTKENNEEKEKIHSLKDDGNHGDKDEVVSHSPENRKLLSSREMMSLRGRKRPIENNDDSLPRLEIHTKAKRTRTLTVSLERITTSPPKSSRISTPSATTGKEEVGSPRSSSLLQDAPAPLSSDPSPRQGQQLEEHGKIVPHPHKCPSCSLIFSTAFKLSSHTARQHLIPCLTPECSETFPTYKARNAHGREIHPDDRAYINTDPSRMSERVINFYKTTAQRDVNLTWKAFKEEGVHRNSVYRYLKKLRQEEAAENPKVKCPREPQCLKKCIPCGKTFPRRDLYLGHVAREHTHVREHVCHICGKDFYTVRCLKSHLKRHDNPRRHRCKMCEATFGHQTALERHRIKEHGADPVICDECGGSFMSRAALREHRMKKHMGIKRCYKCAATFPCREELHLHLKSHTDDPRPHSCPHCEDNFITRAHMREHVNRVHTPNYVAPTPWKCSQCEKSYQFPGLLKKHVLQSHTQERPHTCSQCGKAFVTMATLRLHIKGKHGWRGWRHGEKIRVGSQGRERSSYPNLLRRRRKKTIPLLRSVKYSKKIFAQIYLKYLTS
ncbi:Zinc finger protein 26 [Folsomia candida]|uniref:Zinc finger protein 26 n=1 Tax=Folsomia candida TaxID=158441 RepID=A0A226DB33_FOLCA|nr:Zinc finger protein 26 [Folsomia candida]